MTTQTTATVAKVFSPCEVCGADFQIGTCPRCKAALCIDCREVTGDCPLCGAQLGERAACKVTGGCGQ